jgi:hypothetical protein
MRTERCLLTATFLALLVLLAACSTANEGVAPIPERNASGAFAVTALEGPGTFTAGLLVNEREEAVAVTVTVSDAQDLSGAFVHLSYDTGRYTPERVELSDMLGGEGEIVSLALTDVAGIVPVGIAQITSSGVAPATGDGELATVYFAREPFAVTRTVSSCPKGDYNCVDDLQIIDQDTYTATLRWTEKNVGDYNNDSLVGVADLTPIGQNFNVQVSKSSNPLKLGLIDGNKDDFITVSDITQIGQNFGSQISGYRLYKDADGTNPYSDGITALRENYDSNRDQPIVYTYQADLPVGFVGFTVRPAVASEPGEAGPLSNMAKPVDVPGPPEPPTNLTAVSNETTGHQTVQLNWTASVSTDIATYVVERMRDTDLDWGTPIEIGNTTSYTDHDTAFVKDALYLYRVHAVDFTDYVSTYAELSEPVTPYFVVGPPAPQSVVADNECGVANAIDVQWQAPADDSKVIQYRVKRKAPGETEFSPIFTSTNKYTLNYLDQDLTVGEYYEYFVVSVGSGDVESEPSNTAGNTPCEYVPEIHITGLTTDKLTHCSNGSEPASNLNVATDIAPDSVDWSATAGTINGDGENATWQAQAGMDPVKVTVTCTVHAGTSSDSQTLDLYVCQEGIKTTGLLNQDIGDPLGSGHFIDFNNCDLLLPLAEGGGDIRADPEGRPMSYYVMPDHVVLHGYFRTT